MLNRFDHVTVVVRDVDQAVASYESLFGFGPSWRGRHPELGTQAALFGLSNSLVELVGPLGDSPESDGMRAWLDARGEGLQALAFGTDDAASCSAQLRERGVRATPPQAGEARSTDGRVRHYRAVELSAKATRGIAVLAVERADAAQLMASGPIAPDRVDSLDHVVISTADPQAAVALYGDGLGIRLAADNQLAGRRMLFFRVGKVTIEVVHDPAQAETDRLFGAAYRVRDIDAAHARMAGRGLDVSAIRDGRKQGTRVFTVRDGTAGVPTLILRDPARD